MTKIHDIRSQTPKRLTTRPETNINKIVRHHSATTVGDFWAFWNTWRNLGWIVGGYHEIILRDGTVQLCYDPNMITNGVGGHNSRSYHICVVGNGNFTEAQEKAFEERARLAMKRFNLPISAVVGHRELAPSQCPGIDMNTVRSRLGNTTYVKQPSFANAYSRDCSRFTCRGPEVIELQKMLLFVGERLPRFGADGDFGKETEDKVKAFQSRHSLAVDGIAGPATLKKLAQEVEKVNQHVKTLEERINKLERILAEQNNPEVSIWAEKARKWVMKESISDGTRPKATTTREENWTMHWRAAGSPEV